MNFYPIIAGIETVAIYALYALLAVASYASYARAKKQMQGQTQKQRGTLYQTRASAVPRRLVYGRTRLGGIEAFVAASGLENEVLHYILIWADGPCQAIEAIHADDKKIELYQPYPELAPWVWFAASTDHYADVFRVEHELGDNLVPPAHGLDNIPGWGETDRLVGICYSWIRLRYNIDKFPNGVPSFSAIIQGRNDVYDPRDDTLKYTTNPALCQNHYMTVEKLGPSLPYAEEIGEDELIAAANICGEQVESSAPLYDTASGESGVVFLQDRYSFNGMVSLDENPEDILEGFRTAMAGTNVYVGGRWRVYAGAYVVPTFTIDKSIIVGPVTRRAKSTSRLDRFNTVRGVYASQLTKWQPTDFPAYRIEEYVTEDGEELVEDIELHDTDTIQMCRRLARIFLMRSRYNRVVQVPINIEGLRAQPGCPVYFHFPEAGFNNTPMDVLGFDFKIEDRALIIVVNLRETNPAIYDYVDDGMGGGGSFGSGGTLEPPSGGGPRYADLFTRIDADVTLECKIRGDTLSLCGFVEFTTPSVPARVFKRRSVTGSMQINRYNSGDCTAPYPGEGSQSGNFPVFYFANNFYLGTVTCRITNWNWDAGTVSYSFDGYSLAAGTGDASGGPGPMPPPYNVAKYENTIISAGFTWTQNIGTNFGLSIWIQAIFGWGIGGWSYTAGVQECEDSWNYQEKYNADCSDWAVYSHESERLSYGTVVTSPIPAYYSGQAAALAAGRPDQFYIPYSTLLVQMEPAYVETTDDPTHRITQGLGCVVGTGFGVGSMMTDGDITEALTEEATEASVIADFQEANPWEDIPWAGSTLPGCATVYTERTGISWEYAEAKARLTVYSPIFEAHGMAFVEVYIDREDLSTGDITPTAIEEVEGEIGSNLSLELEFELPVERGYHHFIRSVTVYSIPT